MTGIKVNNVTVQQVDTKEVKTRFGAKPTFSFKGSDGNWYKTGFKEVARVGDCLSFDYATGTYGNEVNVGSIVRAAGVVGTTLAVQATPAPKAVSAPTSNKGSFPIGPLDGQRSIVRQNALTNARELLGLTIVPGTNFPTEAYVARIIEIAKKFEAYTTGDADLEEVKADMAAEKKAA